MFFKRQDADPYRDRYKSVRYRPVSIRRRLLIGLLALATAAVVMLYILGRRDAIVHSQPPASTVPADVSACKGGNTTGCVGGMATVILAPAPAASAP